MGTSTGAECTEITATFGGSVVVCRRSGSVAIERFTGDNPASLVRMGATTPGNVVISLGTTGTDPALDGIYEIALGHFKVLLNASR